MDNKAYIFITSGIALLIGFGVLMIFIFINLQKRNKRKRVHHYA